MSDSSENLAFQGIDSSDSDDDQADYFDEKRRRKQRERAQEDAIYGVFATTEDNDNNDNDYHRGGRGRGRGHRGSSGGRRSKDSDRTGGINIAPQFVKGQVLKDDDEKDVAKEEEDEDGEDEDDMFQSAQTTKDTTKPQEEEVEEQTAAEKALEEQLKQQQETANEYFNSLLAKGKGANNNKRKPVSSSSTRPPRETTTHTMESGGLGYQTGGVGGLGYSEANDNHNANRDAIESAPSFAAAAAEGAGLGMQPAGGIGMPTAFGRNSGNAFDKNPFTKSSSRQQDMSSSSFVKRDPNLGTWEKHTKGIGMKLLAKMGYKGSGGLGAKRRKKLLPNADGTNEMEASSAVEAPVKTGISKPVEVVVRPANLGLGYGNFKEATKLKTNQQIEAEVRGIDIEKQKKEEEAKKQKAEQIKKAQAQRGESSALPSVSDLMQQKSWKRGAKLSQSSRKRPRRTVIPYQELLEKHASKPSVVIDMRGPSTTAPSSEENQSKEVPLGEELLHNLSLLLNTYENKIHSCSHFVRSTKQKVDSLESDIADMERRQQENQHRVSKLNKVLDTLDQIEVILTDNKSADSVDTVQSLVQQLEATFTPEEKAKLRFFDVLAPSLLEPVLQARLDQWDPLESDVETTKEAMEAVVNLCKTYRTANKNDVEAVYTMMQTMFTNLLLPRVKHALESQRWDPIRDVDTGLLLYDTLIDVADKATPPKSRSSSEVQKHDNDSYILPPEDTEEDDGRVKLRDLVQDEIINKTVYFKLARALSQWKPVLDSRSGTELLDRPSSWILPWIPYLDHRSILPTLLADCKRKLKSAMSFLHRSMQGDDEAFCRATLQTLKPWCSVFPKDAIPSLVSASLISRLASFVAVVSSSTFKTKEDGVVGCPSMDWSAVDMAFQMHTTGLVSNKEFLSVIEGELLPSWVSRIQAWLVKVPGDWKAAAEAYMDWRLRLFSGQGGTDGKVPDVIDYAKHSASFHCIRHDVKICAVFYSVLLMIQAAHDSNLDALTDLRPAPTNARAVLARRTREERDKTEEEMLRMEATGYAPSTSGGRTADMAAGVEARVRAAQRNSSGHHHTTPTFREVVEEFAREHDVLFQPRMGSNATKDGKPVFLFGKIPVYLDKDVVFALQKTGEWNPTSLGDLATMAQRQG